MQQDRRRPPVRALCLGPSAGKGRGGLHHVQLPSTQARATDSDSSTSSAAKPVSTSASCQ